jgi:hypothetical protein
MNRDKGATIAKKQLFLATLLTLPALSKPPLFVANNDE